MNRRLLGASACALALLLAGCGGETEDTKALVASGKALEAKVGAPGQNKAMPGKDDADFRAFNAAAEKGLTALGTDAMPVEGLGSFEKLCGPAARIAVAYLSAGTGGMAEGQAKAEAMNANAVRYMDQVFTPLLFSAHCTSSHIPAVEKAVDEKPNEKQTAAINQIRGGAFGQTTGLLQIAGDTTAPADQRKRALDLIVRDAGNFALALSRTQRAQVLQVADAVAQAAPDTAPQIKQVKDSVSGAACGKLCSL